MTIEIERDEWLHVWADTPEKARKFFGLNDSAIVKLERTDGDRKCWAVKSAGE